jgi:chemotaxis family two-component system response regulator Rcp1
VRQLTVLLIEHSRRDARLIQRAFVLAGRLLHDLHDLRVVRDGDETLAYLLRKGAYTDPCSAPRPDVIVLDLHLPRMNGHEVLWRLKQDQRFKPIPIIVLTASGCSDDVRRAYDAGVNAYLRKPVEFARLTAVLGEFGKFWLEIVEHPPED